MASGKTKALTVASEHEAFRGLSPRQAKFVREMPKDMNPVEAGVRAGYQRRSGPRFFADLYAQLQDRVQLYVREVLAEAGVQNKQILNEVALLAFHNPGAMFTKRKRMFKVEDKEGAYTEVADEVFELKDMDELGDMARCIKGIKRTFNARTGEEKLEVELYDKLRALDMLGKAGGAWGGNQGSGPMVNFEIHLGGKQQAAVYSGRPSQEVLTIDGIPAVNERSFQQAFPEPA